MLGLEAGRARTLHVEASESLTMTGKFLGRTQLQTSAPYAHLARESILTAIAGTTGSIAVLIVPHPRLGYSPIFLRSVNYRFQPHCTLTTRLPYWCTLLDLGGWRTSIPHSFHVDLNLSPTRRSNS